MVESQIGIICASAPTLKVFCKEQLEGPLGFAFQRTVSLTNIITKRRSDANQTSKIRMSERDSSLSSREISQTVTTTISSSQSPPMGRSATDRTGFSSWEEYNQGHINNKNDGNLQSSSRIAKFPGWGSGHRGLGLGLVDSEKGYFGLVPSLQISREGKGVKEEREETTTAVSAPTPSHPVTPQAFSPEWAFTPDWPVQTRCWSEKEEKS